MYQFHSVTDQLRSSPRAEGVALRPPETVMGLERLGSGFQTRLSFMRSILRRMSRENWHIERTRFDLDEQGYGTVVYTAVTPERRYSLVGFSQYLEPERRTDRVIAEAWDATFSLYDGTPSDADIARLAQQTPKQEAGRYEATDLVMSRANKSLRLFDYVTQCLSEGRQPDPRVIAEVGYLMRTTAVYGNGKFGMCDRASYADRPELAGPFRAELITVFLIRAFTHDLVEHVARHRNPEAFVPLDRRIKRYLGIGNATGLGMAPFLVTHPRLIHNWFHARETALSRVRAIESVSVGELERFREILARAIRHVGEWQVADRRQSDRIARLSADLDRLTDWTDDSRESLARPRPWDALFRRAEDRFSLEGQEMLVSLLLEPYGNLVDDLAEGLEDDLEVRLDSAMSVGELKELIERGYAWALAIDFSDPAEKHHFWYASEEKLEPRRGVRGKEPGAEKAMPLAIARDVHGLAAALSEYDEGQALAGFFMQHPECRSIVHRIQSVARHPYAEIRNNLIGADCLPVDMLRCKLAYFGASKFDPKSDLWTRITMYQGAALADELDSALAEDWCFPILPEVPECVSR